MFGLYSLFILFAVVVCGYRYGLNNQATLLPAIYHLTNPEVLSNDLPSRDYPVFSRPIIWFVAMIGKVLPLPITMLLLHLVSLALLFAAIQRVSESITPDKPALAWVAIGLLIVLRFVPGSNLMIGGFDVFELNFYGYTLGIALVLFTLLQLLRGQAFTAGILAGLTFYVHANYGQQAVILASAGVLLGQATWREKALLSAKVLAVTALVALPIFVQLAEAEFRSEPPALIVPSYLDVAGMRNPHHLVPGTWPVTDHLQYALSALALLYIVHVRRRRGRDVDVWWRAILVGILVLSAVAYLNGIFRSDLIAKSYFFRSTALLKILFVLYLVAFLSDSLGHHLSTLWKQRVTRYALRGILLFTGVAFILNLHVASSGTSYTILNRPVLYGISISLHPSRFEQWITENTPQDAVFLVPPDYFRFAVNTQRAPVVTWLNLPHGGQAYLEWYSRIVAVSGGTVTLESTREMGDAREIDRKGSEGYDELQPEAIISLGRTYRASFCVSRRELPLELAYRSEDFLLYRIPVAGLAGPS
jgi:hypothetical protein